MSFTSHLRPVSQILTFGKIPGSSLGRTPTRRWCIWGPAWHSHGFGRLFISNPYTSLKGRVFMWGFRFRHVFFGPNCLLFTVILGGGLKYFSFSPLVGEDFQFDEHIFQMGWFNHQPELLFKTKPQTKKNTSVRRTGSITVSLERPSQRNNRTVTWLWRFLVKETKHKKTTHTHTSHVWYIYLHLPKESTKCR